MKYPLTDLIDRFSILRLKLQRLPVDEEIKAEYEIFLNAINDFGNDKSSEWIEKMTEINGRIWDLESDIRKGKEKELGLQEVGRRALAIRDINAERIAYKNEIAKEIGWFKEKKIDHASV